MHEDIVVSNGVWKFTGNPEVACKCLSGKGCIQFPEKSNNGNNPFVSEDSTKTSGKICERVWKFHPYKTCEYCEQTKKDVSVRIDEAQMDLYGIEKYICVCDNCAIELSNDI